MAKKILYPVVAVIGIAAASGAAWWYQSKPKGAPEIAGVPANASTVAGVEVAQAKRLALRDAAQSVGSLQSRQSVMLRPEVAGRIKSLGFRDGAQVRKGQVLVQLDDTLQQAEVKQSLAQVSIAQAALKRNQELVAENFVAQRVVEESSANLQVVEAQLTLSQARLSRMAILAPFNGTVGIRNVNVGDYVKDGADLVNLEDISSMYVDFRLPERYQSKLKPQQPVELALDAFPGRAFTARVEAINPLLDANGRSVSVRAVLPNTLGETGQGGQRAVRPSGSLAPLRPGMFARVTTVFSVNESALVVPEEAIVPQGGRQFVIKVVTPEAVPGTVAATLPSDTKFVSLRQEVKLGVRQQGMVEITGGLTEGQTVVVAGQQRLQRDGTPLRIVTLGQPAQGAASASVSVAASVSASAPAASR
ncbi:MAG: efflux RND transporter periplasmic adaptor subunit [Rhodoferax sp.]|uniref:efflux RND transporter periplasmic adaptor subunit n=1 Tax=Rhodoferax sp. TaxID=50421 RepID=UPI00271F0310|nr:efflux RND transporter periplasmic adaptor subunit [Rhodoferax sp.]MDO8447561.1 efflux RND transporter periplasmic adaptor subunit [Rhodoferax sp.]